MNFSEKMKKEAAEHQLNDDLFDERLKAELRTSGEEIINMATDYMDVFETELTKAGVPRIVVTTCISAISDSITSIVFELMKREEER